MLLSLAGRNIKLQVTCACANVCIRVRSCNHVCAFVDERWVLKSKNSVAATTYDKESHNTKDFYGDLMILFQNTEST
jgi:hypothetical protein